MIWHLFQALLQLSQAFGLIHRLETNLIEAKPQIEGPMEG
jgi:hypothetical protein